MSASVPLQRLSLDDSIVTGQAARLEISPANPISRVLAAVTDMAIAVLGMLGVVIAASYVLPPPSQSMYRVYILLIFLIPGVLWPFVIETLTHGRSVGKWLHNIQVVRDDGGVISARHTLVRVLAGILELWLSLGGIALMTSIFNNRAKRLGDYMAGTMVISVPDAQQYPAVLMPPDAQGWALNATVLPLPGALGQRALMFLRSSKKLSPAARHSHGVALSQELRTFVEPAPPSELHPERFIAAVLVLNRDRQIRTLSRWEEYRHSARMMAGASAFEIGANETSR